MKRDPDNMNSNPPEETQGGEKTSKTDRRRMVTCPKCGQDNRPNALRCTKCKNKLAKQSKAYFITFILLGLVLFVVGIFIFNEFFTGTDAENFKPLVSFPAFLLAWGIASVLFPPQRIAEPSLKVVKFCKSCGAELTSADEYCYKCQNRLVKTGRKSKTTAVLLAVFLGFWAWLYTYKKDGRKFWLNLGLTVVTIGFYGIIAWIWAIVDTARRPQEWYESY
jgi:predicted nucleic acid-binding Zn ribbon protein